MSSTLREHRSASGRLMWKNGDQRVPLDGAGQFVDSGRWRDVGVTHWHLIPPREWAVSDSARFSTENARTERVRSSAGVARSPHEVLDWLQSTLDTLISEHGHDDAMLRSSGILTEEDRRSKAENQFWMAMFGKDVCCMLALRGGRISHYTAYAMTERECSVPH
ncbi:MAG: hypothetical protein ACRDQ0_14240 [Pseudonocardia sp.]